MDEREAMEVEIADDVGRFAETYSSFNQIINKLQRQYLSLKEMYSHQSEELQAVNKTLQVLMGENRAVTEFLNNILNSLSSGVMAIDSVGRISHMNPAARKILGFGEADDGILGAQYNDIMPVSQDPELSALEAIHSGHEIEGREKEIKTRYGTDVNLSVSTSLLKNQSGQIIGAVELFHDISKLRKMEEQLSQMKVLASLGEMAASIAHEIRNPLNGIGGFASLLTRDLEDDPAKKEMARKIVGGVESINRIIQTLLDFARREKIQKSPIDLKNYLSALLVAYAEEYGPTDIGDKLKLEASSGDLIVNLDQHLFRQVFFNLIKNGFEAGGKDTQVTIRFGLLPLVDAQKEYSEGLGLAGTETLVQIIVEDNGPGFSEADCRKMFSPFYSTKENGIGLGLSIAWKIVKAHGGDLSACSQPGRGTKFSILIPVNIN
nr:PAS domain S-box protein [candidate division Zixibacteria bacterium]